MCSHVTSSSILTNSSKIESKLRFYLDAKQKYDKLLCSYDVFKDKAKSIDQAAQMVGLRLPRTVS